MHWGGGGKCGAKRLLQVLRAEQEVHHVTIFHHIFFAFSAHFSGVFGTLLTFERDKVAESNGLSAYVALFKVLARLGPTLPKTSDGLRRPFRSSRLQVWRK